MNDTQVMSLQNFNVENLSSEEFALMEKRMNDEKYLRLQKEIELMKSSTNEKMCSMEDAIDEVKKTTEFIQEKQNNLHQPENAHLKKLLARAAGIRCYKFLKDKADCRYSAFAPYMFKSLYSDLSTELRVGQWKNISAKDHNSAGSQFQSAMDFIDSRAPSSSNASKWVNELKSKRDSGFLSPERCRALTRLLDETNNGANGWF